MASKKTRVRFAPSPTGALHIGGAHTALFNWLYARHTGGSFVLRVEDTDRERSTLEYERTIMDGMMWLGLDWDEGPDKPGPFGPYRQSERLDRYREYAAQLVDQGLAYHDGEAILFKVPSGHKVQFDDVVYGHIEVASEHASVTPEGTIKDIVLVKSDGMPTYNYANVIDDYEMAITCVIRGEDHIANTPKQILIYEAFGWEPPLFGHLPMILGMDKKKLSKRHGATSVFEYSDLGYLPDAVINFLALLGWSPRTGEEVFSRAEAAELFELDKVTKRAAVLDTDKLKFINQEHLKRLDPAKRLELIRPFWVQSGLPVSDFDDAYLAQALELMGGRGQTTQELADYSDYFLSFEPVKARYDAAEIDPERKPVLRAYYDALLAQPSWTAPEMEAFSRAWSEANGTPLKQIAMPLRMSLTGRKVSPGIFEVAELLGREECRQRLAHYGLASK